MKPKHRIQFTGTIIDHFLFFTSPQSDLKANSVKRRSSSAMRSPARTTESASKRRTAACSRRSPPVMAASRSTRNPTTASARLAGRAETARSTSTIARSEKLIFLFKLFNICWNAKTRRTMNTNNGQFSVWIATTEPAWIWWTRTSASVHRAITVGLELC